LKAKLQDLNIPILKIHNLAALLDKITVHEPLWVYLRPALNKLTLNAVEARYPGHRRTKEQARWALDICLEVRRLVRESFGLRDAKKPKRKAKKAHP